MTDTYIIALLDRPSSRSFGMVPFVERRTDGTLRIHGLQGRPNQPLLENDLEQLLQDRSALKVDIQVDTPIPDTFVAGWLGVRFDSEAGGVPLGIPLDKCYTVVEEGRFWLDNRTLVQQFMEQWVKETAKSALETKDARLADLMTWVMPDSSLTRAVIYATRRNEKEKQERLTWWLRLEHDMGRKTTKKELIRRFKYITKHAFVPSVYPLTAVSSTVTQFLCHVCWCGEAFYTSEPNSELKYSCTCGIKWYLNEGSWIEF